MADSPEIDDQIAELREAIAAYEFTDEQSLLEFRSRFTGKKGAIPKLFGVFKTAPPAEKARLGKVLNELKQYAQATLQAGEQALRQAEDSTPPQDLTLPAAPYFTGTRHPLMKVQQRLIEVFRRLGFSVATGPEIEIDWYNFTALNFPPNHPAREMQDTFFVHREPDVVLRTHTSNVQVRVMENRTPPIRIIAPGRVYRNEAISARAHCFFHQIEGLHIETGVSFKDLKQTLLYFAREIFGEETDIRLRPSYFPFTEISAEMDISCLICGGEGCPVCKHSGWVEVLGCGMVDPNVLKNCNIDPEKYTGYAFGMGVERIAQLLYRVPDLRLYSQNDLQFLRQFEKIG